MATRIEMLDELKQRGIEVSPDTHPATLKKMLADTEDDVIENNDVIEDNKHDDGLENSNLYEDTNILESEDGKEYIEKSQVENIIQQMLSKYNLKEKLPQTPKKIKEHVAKVSRIDNCWVVDFVNQNRDEYNTALVHSWQVFNDKTRQFEPWVELVLMDEKKSKTTKKMPLLKYMLEKTSINCYILERVQIDTSESLGQIEKKKEVGDTLVGTGIMTDQFIEQHVEELLVEIGKLQFKIPAYMANH